MRFTAYDINKIGGKSIYKRSANLRLLEDFIDSELECAKVEDFPHKDAQSCLGSLGHSIVHYGMNNIRCIMRNGEIFLIREIR